MEKISVKELNYKPIKDKKVYEVLKASVASNRMNEVKLLILMIIGILLARWAFCHILSKGILKIINELIFICGIYCFAYGIVLLIVEHFRNRRLHKFVKDAKNERILYAKVVCKGIEEYTEPGKDDTSFYALQPHKYYFLTVSSGGQEVEKMVNFPSINCEKSIIGKKVYVVYAGKRYFIMEDISAEYWGKNIEKILNSLMIIKNRNNREKVY